MSGDGGEPAMCDAGAVAGAKVPGRDRRGGRPARGPRGIITIDDFVSVQVPLRTAPLEVAGVRGFERFRSPGPAFPPVVRVVRGARARRTQPSAGSTHTDGTPRTCACARVTLLNAGRCDVEAYLRAIIIPGLHPDRIRQRPVPTTETWRRTRRRKRKPRSCCSSTDPRKWRP